MGAMPFRSDSPVNIGVVFFGYQKDFDVNRMSSKCTFLSVDGEKEDENVDCKTTSIVFRIHRSEHTVEIASLATDIHQRVES